MLSREAITPPAIRGKMKTAKKVLFLHGQATTLLLFALMGPWATSAWAQKAKWEKVTLQMEVPTDKSVDDIKETLLNDARAEAVIRAGGVQVETTTLSDEAWEKNDFFETFRVLSRTTGKGLITREEATYQIKPGPLVVIDYRAKVQTHQTNPDPLFTVDCQLDREAYRTGDAITLDIVASQNSYLTIFSILDNERAAMLFPNDMWRASRLLQGHEPVSFPQPGEAYALTAEPHSEGKKKFSEVLLVVATKEPHLFGTTQSNGTGYNTTWLDINQWLGKIPRDQWTLVYKQYQITDHD